MPFLVQRLYTRGMEVDVNPTREIVLLKLDASIGPGMLYYNHSITYNQVEHKMPFLVQRLYTRGMEVDVNPTREIVLLKLDASIGPGMLY